MIEFLAKQALVRFIRKRLEKRMFKKIREGAGAALVIGLVSSVTGIDIAPDDVDKVMTGIAVIAFYAPQFVQWARARFGKKDE